MVTGKISAMTPVGQAVGQGELIILHKRNGILYELIPIAEASILHCISKSHLRLLADTGKLIAIKYFGFWYVERNLSKHKRGRLDNRARYG